MKKSFLSFPLAVLLTAAGLSAGEKLYQPELTQQVQPGAGRYFTGEGDTAVLNFSTTAKGKTSSSLRRRGGPDPTIPPPRARRPRPARRAAS